MLSEKGEEKVQGGGKANDDDDDDVPAFIHPRKLLKWEKEEWK